MNDLELPQRELEQAPQNAIERQGEEGKHETEEPGQGHSRDLIANLLQVALINKMLPKGYRFELQDTVRKQSE